MTKTAAAAFRSALVLSLLLIHTPLHAADTPPELSAPATAQTTSSGLALQRLVQGKGTVHPLATDVVKVRYEVWNSDGKRIDAVLAPREALLPVSAMIPGWKEGTLMMVEGDQTRLWLTSELASNGKSATPKPLVIDTELLAIIHVPPTPEDVAAPPADATTSKSGLAWKVLQPGTGTTHPVPSSKVTVHYTGWTADGKMFDSSLLRGQPATFPLRGVIAGWTEGLQQMVEGERARFWIPAKLAYGKDPQKPQGMLVFEIELLKIQ